MLIWAEALVKTVRTAKESKILFINDAGVSKKFRVSGLWFQVALGAQKRIIEPKFKNTHKQESLPNLDRLYRIYFAAITSSRGY
jgi:hypothetical protein